MSQSTEESARELVNQLRLIVGLGNSAPLHTVYVGWKRVGCREESMQSALDYAVSTGLLAKRGRGYVVL